MLTGNHKVKEDATLANFVNLVLLASQVRVIDEVQVCVVRSLDVF